MPRLQERTERDVYKKALSKKPELLELAETKLKLIYLERILVTIVVTGLLALLIWII